MAVITIARQLGSGGEEVASHVAAALGARLLDHELLELASARSGIPVSVLEALDERGRNMLMRPVDLLHLVPLPPIDPDLPHVTGDRYPPTGPVLARGEGLVSPVYWALEAYAVLLVRTIKAAAEGGNVVIVGRGGNEALAGVPGTVHVLVTGGEEPRLKRVMASAQCNAFAALDRIQESDRQREAYSRQFLHTRWLDSGRYDLVLNTDALSPEAAARVIVAVARVPAGTRAVVAAVAVPV